MSLLANLSTDNDIVAQGDSAGGFQVLESGIYDHTIDLAYLGTAKSGAISLNLSLKDSNGRMLRQTLWLTSGTAKGLLNYYTDKDGVKRYLPGFEVANDLVQVTLGKNISELEHETKTINLYNAELKREAPTQVPMLTDLLGLPVKSGVRKIVENRSVKVNDAYKPTADTREVNEITKFFRADDGKTAQEILANEEPETPWITRWDELYTGKTQDKTEKDPSKLVAAPAAAGGRPAPSAGAGNAPKTSMFSKPAGTDAPAPTPAPSSGMFSTPAADAQDE